jgi:hypothetical protein
MLTRSLDQIIHATNALPPHLTLARRHYDRSPDVAQALRRLQDALMEVEVVLLRRERGQPRD